MRLDVRTFGDAALYDALSNRMATPDEVSQHDQAQYLFRYLEHLSAKVIVVEAGYIDGDYLDDVANFYVKSFDDYERRCKRLHFFADEWTETELAEALRAAPPPDRLQGSYLGFVVARPLPQAVIGRTVLKTYDTDQDRRHYPTIRPYEANLYGTSLQIDSLAFQEQDTVLAACATVALWSAFHKTSTLFGTTTPTPAEITRSATAGVYSVRPVPSKGLYVPQMARAVREVGLEPEVFECTGILPLLSLLVAYLELGIPPILGLSLEGRDPGRDLHAVAVTGYSLRESRVHNREEQAGGVPIRRIGLRVDELYVHDDGHGPFAKIEARPSTSTDPRHSAIVFVGTWKDEDTGAPVILTPKFVVVPVYHKIRLNFLDLQTWVATFSYVANRALTDPAAAEWAVTLSTTNMMKATIKKSSVATPEIDRVLFSQQPRFIWRAMMSLGGRAVVELLFDATGMARSRPYFDILFHDPAFRDALNPVVRRPRWAGKIDAQFLSFLHEKTA